MPSAVSVSRLPASRGFENTSRSCFVAKSESESHRVIPVVIRKLLAVVEAVLSQYETSCIAIRHSVGKNASGFDIDNSNLFGVGAPVLYLKSQKTAVVRQIRCSPTDVNLPWQEDPPEGARVRSQHLSRRYTLAPGSWRGVDRNIAIRPDHLVDDFDI